MAKSKRTDDRMAVICEWIGKGATAKDAAAVAGMSEATYYAWKASDPEFSEAITRAENECAARLAAKLAGAADEDWRAAESWLKRRRSEDWGDRQSLDLDSRISGLLAALAAGGQTQTP